MTSTEFYPGLPNPMTHKGFYKGIPTKRLLAWVIDTVVIVFVSILIVPFTAFTAVFFFSVLILVVGFLYRWTTIAMGSGTWGMRMMNIELRDARGEVFDGSTALLHTLGYTISVAFPILQIISAITILVSERHQSLTDFVLNTAALNKKLTR